MDYLQKLGNFYAETLVILMASRDWYTDKMDKTAKPFAEKAAISFVQDLSEEFLRKISINRSSGHSLPEGYLSLYQGGVEKRILADVQAIYRLADNVVDSDTVDISGIVDEIIENPAQGGTIAMQCTPRGDMDNFQFNHRSMSFERNRLVTLIISQQSV